LFLRMHQLKRTRQLGVLSRDFLTAFVSAPDADYALSPASVDVHAASGVLSADGQLIDSEVESDSDSGSDLDAARIRGQLAATPHSRTPTPKLQQSLDDDMADLAASLSIESFAPTAFAYSLEARECLRMMLSEMGKSQDASAGLFAPANIPLLLNACVYIGGDGSFQPKRSLAVLAALERVVGAKYHSNAATDPTAVAWKAAMARPELWAALLLSSAKASAPSLLQRIWTEEFVKHSVSRYSSPVLASLAAAFSVLRRPLLALQCLELVAPLIDGSHVAAESEILTRVGSMVLSLTTQQEPSVADAEHSTSASSGQLISGILGLDGSAPASCRRLLLETAISAWSQIGRYDLVTDALCRWIRHDANLASGVAGPSQAAYAAAMRGHCQAGNTRGMLAPSTDSVCELLQCVTIESSKSNSALLSIVSSAQEANVRAIDGDRELGLDGSLPYSAASVSSAQSCNVFQNRMALLAWNCAARLALNTLHSEPSCQRALLHEKHVAALVFSLAELSQCWQAWDVVEIATETGVPTGVESLFALLHVELQSQRLENLEGNVDLRSIGSFVSNVLQVSGSLTDGQMMALLGLAARCGMLP
jgi:hypothetical protein